MFANNFWRYSFGGGGGIVIATTEEEAREKIKRKYNIDDFVIWNMTDDDFYDDENPDVFDLY